VLVIDAGWLTRPDAVVHDLDHPEAIFEAVPRPGTSPSVY
jgi:hypothetical protein